MKIMFINSVIDYGSTGKIVRDLSDGMIGKGHEVKIVYGRHQTSDTDNCFNISNRISTFFHVVMTRLFGRHGLHSNRQTKLLIKEIETFNPDVIHIHNLHGYYLNYKLLMSFLKTQEKTRIVWTLHDLWSITGSSAYYSFDGCIEWDNGCVICAKPTTYPKSVLFHRQRKNFMDKKKAFSSIQNLEIVTVSKWLKGEIENSYLSQYPITPIYNGLDFSFFDKKVSKTNSDYIELLGVANIWETRKGLDDFIKLAEYIPENYRITLVGLTKEQINCLPENIRGVTQTHDYEELIEYYSNADLYLNLSVEETMGMTTVEALAAGTPVVVYDQTAIPEVIDSSVGAVVEAGNILQLLETINIILKKDISELTCKNFARTKYSKDLMMDKYYKIYTYTK